MNETIQAFLFSLLAAVGLCTLAYFVGRVLWSPFQAMVKREDALKDRFYTLETQVMVLGAKVDDLKAMWTQESATGAKRAKDIQESLNRQEVELMNLEARVKTMEKTTSFLDKK